MPAHDPDALDLGPVWAAHWPDVRVACVWLPQLPLRAEVLRRPILDGRPLVLSGAPGERKVVRLCSPEAERAGIRPGLPLREVLVLCPDAVILGPDPVRTAAVVEAVLVELERVSPTVEPDGEQLFLDLRGLAALYCAAPSASSGPSLGRLEQTIRAAVPPLLRPRIGVAGSKFAASIASRLASAADARVVPADETAAFLAPLAIDHLSFAPELVQRLELLGLRTIGDLAALPFAAVQAQFGPVGARAWRLATGRDDEPVVPRHPIHSTRAASCFDDPLASIGAVMVALDQLLARAFADPALDGCSARQLSLRALLVDGTSWERLFTFKEALAGRDAARRALRAKLELPGGLPPAPIEELALELLGLGGFVAKQAKLFVARARQDGQIAEAARQLGARYGQVPLYHAVEVEPWSRIPERRWALVACDA